MTKTGRIWAETDLWQLQAWLQPGQEGFAWLSNRQ